MIERCPTCGHPTTTDEPPRRCARHLHEPSPHPCAACIEARDFHTEWERAKAHTEAAQRSREARESARIRRMEIDACDLCGDNGYTPKGRLCYHDPRLHASTKETVNADQ